MESKALITLPTPELTVARKKDTRARIKAFENAMEADGAVMEDDPHVAKGGLDPVNHFTDGMYARELFMPAGVYLTSKVHKTNHFTFVMYGKAAVIDERTGPTIIEGPCMIKTPAGTKRALQILTDSLWITVHATDDTDLDVLDKTMYSTTYLDLIEHKVDNDD